MSVRVALRHGFSHLLTFRGRDPRSLFWPFAVAVFLLGQVAGMLLVLPLVVQPFLRAQQTVAAHPDLVTVTAAPGGFPIPLGGRPADGMPDMAGFLAIVSGVAVVTVLLLAAAVVRRLHDTGRSGWWGAMPLPFAVASMAIVPVLFAQMEAGLPDMRLFLVLFASNAAYLATVLVLIVWLAGAGTADRPDRAREGRI